MKIGYISDIHIDCGMTSTKLNIYDQDVDVLIIAGDIGNTLQTVSFIDTMYDTFMCPIIVVLDNHDYYNGTTVEYSINAYKETFATDDNIHILVNGESVNIYGQWFIGATLWSDLGERYNPTIAISTKLSVVHSIADFTYIKDMTPDYMIDLFEKDRKGIITTLDTLGTNDVIVITHFSPSIDHRNEDYKIDPLAYYFCGYMDDVIDHYQPKYWIYGHTHGTNPPCQRGDTMVVCNQLYGNIHSMEIINV